MTFRELLEDNDYDADALLAQQVGAADDDGGITAKLEDGILEVRVIAPIKTKK